MYYGLLSDKFDQEKAKGLILNFAQSKQFLVSEFLMGDNLGVVRSGDVLLVPNLSYFGLNLLKSLAGVVNLGKKGVEIIFIEQEELSVYGESFDKMLAVFSGILESERAFISARAKAGMRAAKAKGVKLGRPKGASNKSRVLDNYKSEILSYKQKGVSTVAIMKIVNSNLEKTLSYFTFKNYVDGLG